MAAAGWAPRPRIGSGSPSSSGRTASCAERTTSSRPPRFLRDRARRSTEEVVAFIDAHRGHVSGGLRWGVEPVCSVLEIAPSTYYDAKDRPPSARAERDAELRPQLRALWERNYSVYGRRKLTRAAKKAGLDLGRDQVARLMRAEGLRGASRAKRRFTTHPDPAVPRAPDLVQRDFTATRPEPQVGRRLRAPRGALQPCGGERTPPRARRSGRVEAEGSLIPGTGVRVDSSPDNDGTGQHCQMVRVRQARRKGVREEPAAERPSRDPAARTWRIGAAEQRVPARLGRVGNSSVGSCRRPGGHGEGLRRSRGDVAGA
jgi:hypothetical protein